MTECAPVIAVNCRTFAQPDTFSLPHGEARSANRSRAITVQTVDPDSYAPLPPATPGMLLVKGPNVMDGYLGREDLTARAMQRWLVYYRRYCDTRTRTDS